MFRKGGLSQETGIMSGLDRRGYAQGSYAPRVGYQDGSWLNKLKGLYSSIGRGAGIRAATSGAVNPYAWGVPVSGGQTAASMRWPWLSEKGLVEAGKKIAGKGAGIASGFAQRFPKFGVPIAAPISALALKASMIKPTEEEKEYGMTGWRGDIEKAFASALPGGGMQDLPLGLRKAFGLKKKPEELEPPITKSDADFETTDDIESDLMRAYEERLPVIEKALAGRPSTKSQWLALAKFGAGLAAEPGGDLIGAIGRAAKIPLDDLAKLQEKMEDKKTQAKLLALQGALDVTKPGEIARKVKDVQNLLDLKGPEGKKAAFAIVDRWVSGDRASRAADTKAYRETAKELRVNAAGFLESMEDLKEKHPKLVSKLGITTERLPDLDDLEDDATPGEYYINKEGNILRYDPNREPPLLEPGDKGFEGKWKKKK